ncbi:MAG: phosphoethanolamine--lipid A transferase [Epsilonproteobacteria bacterium]|nr:phosphoethanolamine--lipid A transferase [Campylobacterota bacterium]
MKMSQLKLIILTTIFIIVADNIVFFEKSYATFHNKLFILGLGILLFIVLNLLLLWVNRWIIKPLLIAILLLSSLAAYYMQQYGVVIDDGIIQSIFETDVNEVKDLLNIKLLLYVTFLGIIPSILVLKTQILTSNPITELQNRMKFLGLLIIGVVVLYMAFSKYWVDFFRNHKTLRMYTNPTYFIYSFGRYIHKKYFTKPIKYKQLGMDAHTNTHNKLIFFILGEAARWDHFGINGYDKNTTPNLSNIANLISFTNLYSCGTQTAISVPCMFSIYNRDNYNEKIAKHTDNALDIIQRAKVNVLWLDNDSGSKGVANHINYIDYNHANIRPFCKDNECVDEVLLYRLKDKIKKLDNNHSILIILHTKGSHGPAYYKRYPQTFAKFLPACRTNQLQKCSRSQVTNAYDNTILYTDNFIKQTIQLAKTYHNYQTAVFYMADHGESLGEGGIYLHGLPYIIAPQAQKRPASVLWVSHNFDLNQTCLTHLSNHKFSHDNLFSTLLGLFDIKTNVYQPDMDMFVKCKER